MLSQKTPILGGSRIRESLGHADRRLESTTGQVLLRISEVGGVRVPNPAIAPDPSQALGVKTVSPFLCLILASELGAPTQPHTTRRSC